MNALIFGFINVIAIAIIFGLVDTAKFLAGPERYKKVARFLLRLLALCLCISCVVFIALYIEIGKESDIVAKEEKSSQSIVSFTSVGPKKYLRQEGDTFQCYTINDDEPLSAPIKNTFVYYDTNDADAHVIVYRKVIKHQKQFLFLANNTSEIITEYEFHIPSSGNIVFGFEKSE